MFVHQNLVCLSFSQKLFEYFVVVVAIDYSATDISLLEVDEGSLGRR